jgi:PAS domain S-box-containing protein
MTDTRIDRVAEIFDEHKQLVYRRTDHMFAVLMTLQWVAGVAAALWVSPKTWAGTESQTHPHVWAALFLGGAISSLPIVLALTRPGRPSTRYAVGIGQMLMGALLIHLTGGRIETHFHVFGSLAFLSFYRDWRVLVPATVVVAADHFLRGLFWPQSVYGVLTASEWRWLEHAGWVLFEDTFLFIAIRHGIGEMYSIAERTAQIESLNEGLEAHVASRTAELVAANSELQKSEERFRQIAENIREVFWITEPKDNKLIYISPAYEEVWGRTCESLPEISQMWRDTIHPEDQARVFATAENVRAGNDCDLEYRIVRSNGEIRWVRDRAFPVSNDSGEVYRIAGIMDDVTESKQSIEQIKTSLHEKEVLLKEIHHRVKNNMQVITSLLSLQAKTISDKKALTVFEDSQNRVKSMALIHETLYQSKDLSRINFAEYLQKLVAHVSRSYRLRPNAVKINLHVNDVALPIDTAVPCGLIINELASNALKYAFPADTRGEVNITFGRTDDQYTLCVSDTGVGLPPDFEPEQGKSLGMKLVRMLTSQLSGEMEYRNGVGTTFQITFPEEREVRA